MIQHNIAHLVGKLFAPVGERQKARALKRHHKSSGTIAPLAQDRISTGAVSAPASLAASSRSSSGSLTPREDSTAEPSVKESEELIKGLLSLESVHSAAIFGKLDDAGRFAAYRMMRAQNVPVSQRAQLLMHTATDAALGFMRQDPAVRTHLLTHEMPLYASRTNLPEAGDDRLPQPAIPANFAMFLARELELGRLNPTQRATALDILATLPPSETALSAKQFEKIVHIAANNLAAVEPAARRWQLYSKFERNYAGLSSATDAALRHLIGVLPHVKPAANGTETLKAHGLRKSPTQHQLASLDKMLDLPQISDQTRSLVISVWPHIAKSSATKSVALDASFERLFSLVLPNRHLRAQFVHHQLLVHVPNRELHTWAHFELLDQFEREYRAAAVEVPAAPAIAVIA